MNREEIGLQVAPALQTQLDELATANHSGAGSVVKQLDRADVRARILSVDRLACEVESIVVTSPSLRQKTADELETLATTLSHQLSYLAERIVVVEVDRKTPQVQMRSESPHREPTHLSYFEVNVGRQCVTLLRFKKAAGNQREPVPAVMTRDIFKRVCIDLLHAVN